MILREANEGERGNLIFEGKQFYYAFDGIEETKTLDTQINGRNIRLIGIESYSGYTDYPPQNYLSMMTYGWIEWNEDGSFTIKSGGLIFIVGV